MDICRDTYVVRIYRRNTQDPRAVVGVVEVIGGEEEKTFKTFEELRRILHPARTRGMVDKKEKGAEQRS